MIAIVIMLQLVQELRDEVRQWEGKCSTLSVELASVKSHIQEGNYKIDHFNEVKRLESCTFTMGCTLVQLDTNARDLSSYVCIHSIVYCSCRSECTVLRDCWDVQG